MGQFDSYIDRKAAAPPGVVRAFCLVAPVFMIIQAVGSHRLEDILMAGFGVVLFLPSGIAPRWYRARLAALQNHLVLGAVFTFSLMLCVLFILLATFFNRSTSIYIATPVALVLTTAAAVRQHTRLRATK
ncbi:hypothetical protein [Kribbella jiaozuonensis]|uniref:Uncharacterized protein n=1 Tax=Kribbella jiaozuonensis TaxID=2575441 RepID=A0A4U3M299_9ACTN|nr:hypothetical protein [Kribbella jiaozuonensis]TKK81327.1 hypothetical protein FDA38_00150 [Kribbella jiaozuonensis]